MIDLTELQEQYELAKQVAKDENMLAAMGILAPLLDEFPAILKELEVGRKLAKSIKDDQDVEKMDTIIGYLESYHSKYPIEFHASMSGVIEELKDWRSKRDSLLAEWDKATKEV